MHVVEVLPRLRHAVVEFLPAGQTSLPIPALIVDHVAVDSALERVVIEVLWNVEHDGANPLRRVARHKPRAEYRGNLLSDDLPDLLVRHTWMGRRIRKGRHRNAWAG